MDIRSMERTGEVLQQPNGSLLRPVPEFGALRGKTYEERLQYSGQAINAANLLEGQLGALRRNPIVDYVQVAPTADLTQYLPSFPAMAVEQQGKPGELGYSGRVCDIVITTSEAQLSRPDKIDRKTVSVLNEDFAPGIIYARRKVHEAERYNVYSPLTGMSRAFAVFVYDPDARFPLSGEPGQDAVGDWRLADVLTNKDANPENAYVEDVQFVHREIDYGDYKVTEPVLGDDDQPMLHVAERGLLTRLSTKFQAQLRERYLGHDPESVLKGVAKFYYEKFSKGAGRQVTGVSRRALELADDYFKYNTDPFQWRIPRRAYEQLQEVDPQVLRQAGIKGGPSAQARQAKICTEMIEAFGMANKAYDLRKDSGLLDGENEIDPVRWWMRVLDKSDITFASLLGRVTTGAATGDARMADLGERMREAATKYSNATGVELLIESTQGNQLLHGKSFKDDDTDKAVEYVAYIGNDIPHETRYGAYASEMVRSIYDNSNLMMPGMVGRIETESPDVAATGSDTVPFLVVDLMRAPKLLKVITEAGYFDHSQPSPIYRKTLSSMLATPQQNPTLVIADLSKHRAPEVLEVLREGQAAEFVVNSVKNSIRQVRLQRAAVMRELDIYRSSRRNTREPLMRGDRRLMKERYGVVSKQPISPEQITIAGIAVHGRSVHIRSSTRPDVKMTVMRNQGRPRR